MRAVFKIKIIFIFCKGIGAFLRSCGARRSASLKVNLGEGYSRKVVKKRNCETREKNPDTIPDVRSNCEREVWSREIRKLFSQEGRTHHIERGGERVKCVRGWGKKKGFRD